MARTLRSTHAKRRAKVTKVRHTRTKVKRHNHRRYAGIRGRPKNAGLRRKRAIAKGRSHTVRKGVKRRFLGRKKSATERVMRKGLKRTFKGRRKVTMRKGLHRQFKGRAKVVNRKKPVYTHPRKRPTKKLKQAARGQVISAQSYISMF